MDIMDKYNFVHIYLSKSSLKDTLCFKIEYLLLCKKKKISPIYGYVLPAFIEECNIFSLNEK